MHVVAWRQTLVRLALPAAMLGVVAVLAAPPRIDHGLAARVPASIRADGVVTVATDPSYEPSQFTRPGSGEVAGVDAELIRAVLDRLGLTVRWQPTPLNGVLSRVQSGESELGVSALPMTDTATGQVTMVGYFVSGTRWLARAGAGNPGPEDACGQTVGVVSGTVQADDIADRSARCAAAGRPPIAVTRYTTVRDANRALTAGDIDALVGDSHVCDYLVHVSEGAVRATGARYDPVTYGLAVRTADREFAVVLQEVLVNLIKDGTYKRILDTWGQPDAAVGFPAIRP